MAAKDKKTAPVADATLTMLVGYYESFVETTSTARQLAERDRDYYDNKQLTEEEIKTLTARGQPPVIINRIGEKVDYYLGLERQTRTDPMAYPRTPKDEDGAHAATDAIRFVCDKTRYPVTRSEVFENVIIEGAGAVIVEVKARGEKQDIEIRRIPWDRFYYDPHSAQRDFGDSKFKGIVAWLDLDDAKAKYPQADVDGIYDAGLQAADGNTHDDRPRLIWSDKKRKRVRLCEVYYQQGGKWMYAVHGKGGFALSPQDSSYQDEDQQPCCPIEAQSCFVDRENARYGVVRRWIGPQDEINKRRSKGLHLAIVQQTIGERGAVDDVGRLKKQKNDPNGHIEYNPGTKLEFVKNVDMANLNIALLQEAKAEIDVQGANAALSGKQSKDASGRALEARQQGGLVQIGPTMDVVKQFDQAVYRQCWNRVKQYWTAETWVRVTDDEKNARFVGLNTPMTAGEKMLEDAQAQGAGEEELAFIQQQILSDPRAQEVVGIRNNTAEMDVDINLEDSPDAATLLSEQATLLTEMYKANPQNPANPNGMPFDIVIEALPNLRNKQKILDRLKQAPQPGQQPEVPPEVQQHQQGMMQLEQRGAAAEVMGKEAKAAGETAKAEKTAAETDKVKVDTLNAMQQPQRDQQRFEQQQAGKAQQRPPPR